MESNQEQDAFQQWRARASSIAHNQERAIARDLLMKAASGRPTLVPSKRQVKQAKKSFRAIARKEQPDCMLNMQRPKFHRPSPAFVGERERRLISAYLKRKK